MFRYNNEMFNPVAMFDMPPTLVEFFSSVARFNRIPEPISNACGGQKT